MKTKIIYLDRVNSTNTFLKDYAKDYAEEGIVVTTKEQYAGRGQHGRIWQSLRSVNMTFSVLLCPKIALSNLPLFNAMISCTIYDFISQYISNLSIKWPNDIYVGSKKIAGILIENQFKNGEFQSIVGIGINVNQQAFELDQSVSSFILETGKSFDLEILLDEFLKALRSNYSNFQSNASYYNSIYLSRLYKKDQVSCFSKGDLIFNGIVRSVNLATGNLVLELEDDLSEEFSLGELKWL